MLESVKTWLESKQNPATQIILYVAKTGMGHEHETDMWYDLTELEN